MKHLEKQETIAILKENYWNKCAKFFIPYNTRAISLIRFIRGRSVQYKLNLNQHQPEDILIQACIRGIEYIEREEKEIVKLEVWLRITCLNILREKVRENIRNERVIETYTAQYLVEEIDVNSQDKLITEIEQVNTFFWKLSTEDQEILDLRFIQHLSYKEIKDHFLLKGENINVNALRKRTSRALERLREKLKRTE